jgi:hypothetical protein
MQGGRVKAKTERISIKGTDPFVYYPWLDVLYQLVIAVPMFKPAFACSK